jgi:predicted dehydrogenase
MKILLLGSGVYVNGGTNNNGVVLPILLKYLNTELDKNNKLELHLTYSRIISKQKSVQVINYFNNLLFNNIKFLKLNFRNNSELKKLVLRNNYDACIVVLPDHVHYNILKILIPFQFPILVVKPFVLKFKDALNLFQLNNKFKNFIQIEHHKRFDISNRLAKKMYYNRSFGDIIRIDVQYSQNIDIPLKTFKWASNSNIFSYLGVHYVDFVYWFTNREYLPTTLYAKGVKNILLSNGLDTYDTIDVISTWSNGINEFTFNITCNWIESNNSSAQSQQYLKITGSKSKLDLDQTNRGIELTNDHGLKYINPYYYHEEVWGQNLFNVTGYANESFQSFFNYIDLVNKKNNDFNDNYFLNDIPIIEDGIFTALFIDKVAMSLKNKKPINFYENEFKKFRKKN